MNKVAETGLTVFRQKGGIPGAGKWGLHRGPAKLSVKWVSIEPYVLLTLWSFACHAAHHTYSVFDISSCHSMKQKPMVDGNKDSRPSGHQSPTYKMPVVHLLMPFLLTATLVLLDQNQIPHPPPSSSNMFLAIRLLFHSSPRGPSLFFSLIRD